MVSQPTTCRSAVRPRFSESMPVKQSIDVPLAVVARVDDVVLGPAVHGVDAGAADQGVRTGAAESVSLPPAPSAC